MCNAKSVLHPSPKYTFLCQSRTSHARLASRCASVKLLYLWTGCMDIMSAGQWTNLATCRVEHPVDRVTLLEAAEILGISQSAACKRIKPESTPWATTPRDGIRTSGCLRD